MAQAGDRGKTPERGKMSPSPTQEDDTQNVPENKEHGIAFFKGFKPSIACLTYWRSTMGLLAGDFFMRMSITFLTIQVAKFETGEFYGYTGLLPFYLDKYYGAILAGIIGIFVSSVLADSVWTVGIVCLVFSGFVFTTALLGYLTTGIFQIIGAKSINIVFIVMNVFILSMIIFEPSTLAMVFERADLPTNETILPVIWTICILMVWLREMATMVTIIVVCYHRRERNFGIIINSLSIGFAVIFVIYVCLLKQIKEKRSKKIKFIQAIFVLLLQSTPKPDTAAVQGTTNENKFTNKYLGNAFALAKITKFISSFVVFYYAQQFLIIVWSKQVKIMRQLDPLESLGSRFLVLTLPNLINVPFVNVLFIAFYPKMKRQMRIDDLKLLGFAYLALFISLILTTIAHSTVVNSSINTTALFKGFQNETIAGKPAGRNGKFRLINESNRTCSFSTKWLKNIQINSNSMYQSDSIAMAGVTGGKSYIECANKQLELTKSIFLCEDQISTFIITTKLFASNGKEVLVLRRVDKYELTGIKPFCNWDVKASVTVYSTFPNSGSLTFSNENDKFDLLYSDKIHESFHKFVPVGVYGVNGFSSKDKASDPKWQFIEGGVHGIMVRQVNSKTVMFKGDFPPWERKYEYLLNDCLKRWHPWSLIALYFLSLSQSIESVIMLHFVIAESPHGLRCALISLLVFAKLFGSAVYYATELIWRQNLPVVGMFITSVFLTMNACLYWYTSARYMRPEYPPPET